MSCFVWKQVRYYSDRGAVTQMELVQETEPQNGPAPSLCVSAIRPSGD